MSWNFQSIHIFAPAIALFTQTEVYLRETFVSLYLVPVEGEELYIVDSVEFVSNLCFMKCYKLPLITG